MYRIGASGVHAVVMVGVWALRYGRGASSDDSGPAARPAPPQRSPAGALQTAQPTKTGTTISHEPNTLRFFLILQLFRIFMSFLKPAGILL